MGEGLSYSGGCQCGAVRYHVEGRLDDPHLCHCRMCQKAAGNYFMPLAGTDKATFSITRGEPSWFFSSAPIKRGFCSNCGTPLFFASADEEHLAITLGSLDDPTAVPPVSTYGTEARMPFIAEACSREGRTTESDEVQDGVHLAEIRQSNHQHPDHDTDQWPEDRV